MNKLRDLLNEAGVDEGHWNALLNVTKECRLKKGDHLIREGEVCSFWGFVESGILRSYIINDSGEFNVDFYQSGAVVSAYTSFLTQSPAHGYIQALTDTTIHTICYSDYCALLDRSAEWFKLGKYIADTLFIKKCRREASLLTDSAAERFQMLLKTHPKIEQQVAQYHIASYLGIKPESLSRIKSLTYINAKRDRRE